MVTNIYDLDQCELSRKNGLYGGAAGSKDGIIKRVEKTTGLNTERNCCNIFLNI